MRIIVKKTGQKLSLLTVLGKDIGFVVLIAYDDAGTISRHKSNDVLIDTGVGGCAPAPPVDPIDEDVEDEVPGKPSKPQGKPGR